MTDKLILAIVTITMLTNFLDAIFGGVLQPVYVNKVYGNAIGVGLLLAANGGGAVIGGLIFASIGHRLPRRATFIGAFIFTGVRYFFYLAYPPLATLVITGFIFSLGAGPLSPMIGAIEFERIPQALRGRVFGAVTASSAIAMPLGMLVGGFFTEKFGLLLMFIALTIAFFTTTISMAFIPAMKEMNRKN
jgi:MFS family permease